MQISLLVTTYNWKEALGACLDSVLHQTVLPSEVLIADDGSREDTKQLIEDYARIYPCQIIHVWQEDRGFRAAKIRNMAIARSSSDYIVMVDGDMVLYPGFIEDHVRVAKPNHFTQGTRILAGNEASGRILSGSRVDHLTFSSPDIRNRKNTIHSIWLSKVFSSCTSNIKGIRTCNFAAWRQDILAVNGFNEAFEGWGREDSEFAVRLMNRGVKRQNIKFLANAIHLHHQENSRKNFDRNDALLAAAISSGATRCEVGIDQYLL